MRMTNSNPNGAGYRLALSKAGSMRAESQQEQTVYYGPAIDLLGAYEDIGTPEELMELKRRFGTKK